MPIIDPNHWEDRRREQRRKEMEDQDPEFEAEMRNFINEPLTPLPSEDRNLPDYDAGTLHDDGRPYLEVGPVKGPPSWHYGPPTHGPRIPWTPPDLNWRPDPGSLDRELLKLVERERDQLHAENAALKKRVEELKALFNPPEAAQARYKGVKTLVIISHPVSTDPLIYHAQYIEGDMRGKNLRLSHDDLEFIDPVRVVPQSYIQGLLDRIKTLEASDE